LLQGRQHRQAEQQALVAQQHRQRRSLAAGKSIELLRQ
jgi:hypothetical protein